MYIHGKKSIYLLKKKIEKEEGSNLKMTPLQFVRTSIQNREKVCNSESNYSGKVKEKMLCAEMIKADRIPPKTGVCSTTRGGGLYCVDDKVVTGVLSFGFPCGGPDIPSVYTQVCCIYN